MIEKIRPSARVEHDYGMDGRSGLKRRVVYFCPKCVKFIRENDMACDNCGTFFDWSKKAEIEIREEIIWR